MSTSAAQQTGEEMLFLPEEIEQDQQVNLRPFSPDLQDLEELAQSIQLHGQIENVVVRLDEGGRPHLVAGRRRVTAISLLNAGLEEPLRVRATVRPSMTDGEAWLMAWAENKDRASMSPMDIAGNIQFLRTQDEGLAGKTGTKKIAQSLGVSPAFITTHEKLLGLPKKVQQKVHAGTLSVDAALASVVQELTSQQINEGHTPEGLQEQIVETAEQLAASEQEKRKQQGKGAAKKGKGGSAVKGRHVKAAKRQVIGQQSARSKVEVVELLETEIDGPIFGYENGPIRVWAQYFLKWLRGEGTDKGWVERFKVMVEEAPRGTEDKKAEGAEVITAAPGKAKVKPAAKKKASTAGAKKKSSKPSPKK